MTSLRDMLMHLLPSRDTVRRLLLGKHYTAELEENREVLADLTKAIERRKERTSFGRIAGETAEMFERRQNLR